MQMEIHDFVLAALAAWDGEIKGKTALQKLVYFVGVLAGDVEALGYHPHYYGPYSGMVADAMSDLQSLGFVSEHTTSYGADAATGFEICRHDYTITKDGEEIVDTIRADHSDELRKIEDAAKQIEAAGPLDYMELSVAAKGYWLLTRAHEGEASIRAMKDTARSFGWHISKEELGKACAFLEKIGLVTKQG